MGGRPAVEPRGPRGEGDRDQPTDRGALVAIETEVEGPTVSAEAKLLAEIPFAVTIYRGGCGGLGGAWLGQANRLVIRRQGGSPNRGGRDNP